MSASKTPNYTVSARKYRPQHWDAVVGQDSITKTLKQAIEQEQVAQAYLFCGPRGVGKTTSARIFARAINGFEAGEPEEYAFNVFELDAASNNKVEDIRSIVDQVRIPPQQGRYKVYIIDEVHMLSQAAFNAFLKTLEEPPPHAVFVLATTEKHKILPTILSRCQIFDFHRITVADMVTHLQGICEKEGIQAEEAALHVVAVKADGALRDALSILDQLVAFTGTVLTYQTVSEHLHVLDQQTYFNIVDAVRAGEISKALLTLDEIIGRGFDPHHFITGLGAHLRNLLVSKDPQTISLMEVTEDVKAQFAQQAAEVDLTFLVRAMELVNEADVRYKSSNHQRLLVELTMLQMASLNEAEKKKPELQPIVTNAWSSGSPAQEIPAQKPHSQKVEREPESQRDIPSVQTETDLVPLNKERAAAKSVEQEPVVPAVGPHSTNGEQAVRTSRLKFTAPETLVDDEALSLAPSDVTVPVRAKSFTDDELQSAWDKLKVSIESEEQFTFLATLHAAQIKKGEHGLVIEVLNKLQEEQVIENRLKLVQFLSDSLENDELNLSIEVQLPEENSMNSQYLNDRERYDVMCEQNPSLDQLRKRLDLDLLG